MTTTFHKKIKIVINKLVRKFDFVIPACLGLIISLFWKTMITATLRLKLCLQLFVEATAYCKVFFVVPSFVSCFNKSDWKEVLSRLDL